MDLVCIYNLQNVWSVESVVFLIMFHANIHSHNDKNVGTHKSLGNFAAVDLCVCIRVSLILPSFCESFLWICVKNYKKWTEQQIHSVIFVCFTKMDTSVELENVILKLPLTQAPVIESHVPPEQWSQLTGSRAADRKSNLFVTLNYWPRLAALEMTYLECKRLCDCQLGTPGVVRTRLIVRTDRRTVHWCMFSDLDNRCLCRIQFLKNLPLKNQLEYRKKALPSFVTAPDVKFPGVFFLLIAVSILLNGATAATSHCQHQTTIPIWHFVVSCWCNVRLIQVSAKPCHNNT